MECWQECLQREIIIPTHLIRDKDGDGRVNRIYTDYLTGPVFAEFSAQVVQALHVPESEVMPAHGEDELSMSAPENTLEDHLADESALSSSSHALQRPNCDHQTVVDLKGEFHGLVHACILTGLCMLSGTGPGFSLFMNHS